MTTARNDLAALQLTTLLGRSVSSRTIASFYVNRDDIDADAQFRNEARRSNAPSDEVGFGLADVDFARELGVRDLALRQELVVSTGAHLVESGLEVHRLRTETALAHRRATATRPRRTARASRAGRGFRATSTRRWTRPAPGRGCRTAGRRAKSLSLEGGAPSRLERREPTGDALAPARRDPAARRVDAAAGGRRPLHAEPRLREAHPVRLLRGSLGRARALAAVRAGGPRGARPRARLRPRPQRAGRGLLEGPLRPRRRPARDRGGAARPRRARTTSRPSSPRASPRTPSSRASR